MIMRKISISILLLSLFLAICAQNYQKTVSGIHATVQGMEVELSFYSPSIVRVLKYPLSNAPHKESLSVIKDRESVSFDILQESTGDIVLSTSDLKVQYNLKTGKVAFFSNEDKPLLTEKDYGTQFTPRKDAKEYSYEVRQAFMLDAEEPIYGLGQQQDGLMNQRNQKLFLRQQNTRICIPFFQSVKGYGVYWDNYSPTMFTDNPQELSFTSEVGACSDYYFMYGGTLDGVVSQVRELTGQAPLFPLWTMGFWQCRERYKSQDELLEVVHKYRDLEIPLDGIIQDWQYWGTNGNWNSMSFDNPDFPEPKKMIDEVHRNNAHLMISIWASFGMRTPQYKAMEPKGMLYDIVTWPMDSVKPYDAFNPEAREIYWSHLSKLFDLGIDAWWTDCTEPDHFNIKESDFDLQTYLGSFRKVRNAFPLQSNKGVYEHQRAVTSDKRVFMMSRSSFMGQQRYAASSWSGDVDGCWENFRKQIPAGLNFSLCGIPYWNSDIGGFSPWKYPNGLTDPAYHELQVRWFQFGTFCPIMRSHNTGFPSEIYQFGSKGDWAYDAQVKYVNLRYRLLPYIYSTCWDITDRGGSMMRALVMDFPQDSKVHNLDNEYLFGKSILVAPVTDSLYTARTPSGTVVNMDAIKRWPVYLPQGCDWYDFWTMEKYSGGKTIQKEVPIDIIPLYIKAGTILPMGPAVQYSSEKKWDNLELRIYPGQDADFILYEDELDNYNYEKGQYSTIHFVWNDATRQLTIDNRSGKYPGMLKSRKFIVTVCSDKENAGSETLKPDRIIRYFGEKIVTQF